MNKIIKSFKDKRFKYGTYSTITAFIVIAALIVINVITEQLDIKYDLTVDNKYSVSDKTKEIINDISNEITIYSLFKTGEEEKRIEEILDYYSKISSNINVINKDPYLYPQFTSKYAGEGKTIDVNSIIIESGDKFKVISQDELYQYDYTSNDYIFDAESKITGAIQYVTMENLPVIYFVDGHNEMDIPFYILDALTSANYKVEKLDIIKTEGIPEDCTALFMTTPEKDYSKEEAEYIKKYLLNDGRAAVFIDYNSNFENLNSILSDYGVEADHSIIFEKSSNNYYMDPSMIIPNISEHEITKDIINKGYILMASLSQGLKEMDIKKNTVEITPILVTTADAYGKSNDNPQSINYEEGDSKGPFNLAVAVTDNYYTDTNHTTKLVVFGSSTMISDYITSIVGDNNIMFVINSINWLNDQDNSIYVPSKSLSSGKIIMDSYTMRNIIIFSCIVMPVIIFATGIIVWIRRRNR